MVRCGKRWPRNNHSSRRGLFDQTSDLAGSSRRPEMSERGLRSEMTTLIGRRVRARKTMLPAQ